MAQENFSIEYWWKECDHPDQLGDHRDWPAVMQALYAFLAHNEGAFRIRVGTEEPTFDLMPDLVTIFGELPDVLGTLKNQENIPVELDMFEQGTDIRILLRRYTDRISMRFETAPGSGAPYRLLSDKEFLVPAHVFFSQWQRFLLAILGAMSEAKPDVSQDENFVSYRNAISGLTTPDLSEGHPS